MMFKKAHIDLKSHRFSKIGFFKKIGFSKQLEHLQTLKLEASALPFLRVRSTLNIALAV